MLGFENTQEIEMKVDGMLGSVKQEVRLLDGSIFLAHWHPEKQYWSYDQLCRELIEAYDFSKPKRDLLEKIYENLEDIRLTMNTLDWERGCIDEAKVGDLIIRNK